MQQFISSRKREDFSVIYQRNHQELFRFIRWLSGDRELAEDITQNVFLKVFCKPQLFDPNKSLKVWLFSIAKNHWKNELRKRGVAKLHQENTPESDESEQVFHAVSSDTPSETTRLNQAMNSLSSAQREVVVLKYTNNLSIAEIAAFLNCSEGTVKSRLFYALKNLKEIVKEER